jgi:hypothetical protein
MLGDGESVVAEKMLLRRPPSLIASPVTEMRPGQLYEVIRNGYGFMGAMAADVRPEERWEIVSYVRALQRASHADVALLPRPMREELDEADP